jgi:hypothetical protein
MTPKHRFRLEPTMTDTAKQPEIRWVEYSFYGGTIIRVEHDGPCVFVDDQCSCGILDLGVVEGDQ